MRIFIGFYVAAFGATAIAAFAGGQPFDLSRFTIDSGGVMRSVGGAFELSGTIGQPDAGALSGGSFTLTGGFWFETPPGDCNATGSVGLLDHEAFVNCLTGPASEIDDGCECFDADRSGTVDLSDVAHLQTAFDGS